MKTTPHTPGPWAFHLGRGAKPRLHIQTSAGYQIASTPEVSCHKPEAEAQEANARLMCEAPAMLTALENLIAACQDSRKYIVLDDDQGFAAYQYTATIIQEARAAIAQAKGEATP